MKYVFLLCYEYLDCAVKYNIYGTGHPYGSSLFNNVMVYEKRNII